MTSLYGFQPSSVVLFMQNSDFKTRLTSLCGSPVSPVDLCNRNSVLTTRIASLCCPRPHLCIFANKTACHTSPYGSQTSPVDLWMQNSVLSTRITSLYWFQPSSVGFACKRVILGPQLQVSVGPRPHLWFLHAKQRILGLNMKSLWVPDMTYR